MNQFKYRFLIIAILLGFALPLAAQNNQKNFNNLEFIENKGQWNNEVKYKADFGSGVFFLRKNGIAVLQHNTDDLQKLSPHGKITDLNTNDASSSSFAFVPNGGKALSSSSSNNSLKPTPANDSVLHSHIYFMDFVGYNENVEISGEKPKETYNNYFIGNDPSKWKSDCKIYQSVMYKNIYPNIDLHYFTNDGLMKYEFIVNPGGDPSQVAMLFRGADKLSIKNNQLIIKTSVGDVTELDPYTYQYVNGQKVNVNCRYEIEGKTGNTVRFKLKEYNNKVPLIIDPTVVFVSFSGSRSDNWGYTATYGNDGTFFSGGIVFSSGFVTTPGAYQTDYKGSGSGNYDAYFNMAIMRYNASGTQRIYGTYLGGSNMEQPHSMFADAQNNLVIAGRTCSPNYPTTFTKGALGGWDIVVSKLSADGKSLLGSARIGGTGDDGINIESSHSGGNRRLLNFYGDDARSEVILDKSGNVYVASCTQSTNFPVTDGTTAKGKQDAVLLKLDANLSNLLISSVLGGSDDDAGYVLALDPQSSDIYIAGATASSNFSPMSTSGVLQSTFGGGTSDGFIAVYSNIGTFKKATYLGGSSMDVIYGIQFDKYNSPYVMGVSNSNWKKINATWGQDGSRQFVGKLKEDLSDWVFRTHFGTVSNIPNMSPVAFLVDRCQNMYVSGWGIGYGSFSMAGVNGMPVTADAYRSTSDNRDFYFIVIKKDADDILYGSYFGQVGGSPDHVDGGTSRFDQNGVIYQGICANCYSGAGQARPTFPVTAGAVCCANKWSGAYGTGSGAECNMAAVKIAFNFAGVGSGIKAYIGTKPTNNGCAPATFDFKDTVLNAKSYIWTFGDGSPDVKTTSFDISHTYPNVGNYTVRLIAIDSSTCNISDTAYATIRVRSDKADIEFNAVKQEPCSELKYKFYNTSIAPATKPFTAQSFIWDFGDGTRTVAGTETQDHSYASAGTYQVMLILNDTNYCNAPDSMALSLRVAENVKAQFETPPTGCLPYNAVFENTSLAGDTFTWDFGDGTTSSDVSPTHTYNTAGTYIVKLKAYDPNTCNKEDSASFTITVYGAPVAAFTFSPVVPVENTPVTFTNTSSSDAVRFAWHYGDGVIDTTTSRSDRTYQYNATGTFSACLEAFNKAGCSNMVCQEVRAIVVPKLDVPNAFTPNGPYDASIVKVRGYGIWNIRFKIYNRWGQKVFETTDRNKGWDGRFNGTLQPMDVYTYTLEVEFTDGTKASKKGDITLLR